MKTASRLHVWLAFVHAHSTVTQAVSQDLLAELGLPLISFEVLDRLEHADGNRMRMQDLAAGALLSPSGLTRMVDRMEKLGLVERASCPSDRRVIWTVLTENGRGVLKQARPIVKKAVTAHLSDHLSGDEADQLLAIYMKLLNAHGQQASIDSCTKERT